MHSIIFAQLQFRRKRVFLSKLAWSRDVTGKVDNIHSNFTLFIKLVFHQHLNSFIAYPGGRVINGPTSSGPNPKI